MKKTVYVDKNISDEIFKSFDGSGDIVEHIRKNNDHVDGIIDAFEKKGYRVVLNLRNSYFLHGSVFRSNTFLRYIRRAYLYFIGRYDRVFLDMVIRKDIVNSNASIYFTELNHIISKETLQILKKNNIKSIEWFGLFPDQFNENDNILRTVPYFDIIVSCCDILPLFDKKKQPAKFLETFPAYNPKTIKSFNLSRHRKYKYDVVFIGSVSKIHSNRWEVLELLANKYENFVFFGYGVDQVPDKYKFKNRYNGSVWTEEYFRVIQQSKIVVNLFLNNYEKVQSGINLRSIEIPICQSFELSQYIPGLEKYFEIGQDIEAFRNNQELIEKIDFFLNNDTKRENIAKKGYKRVAGFTYENQLEKILDNI